MSSARDELFSGDVPVDDVIEFYLKTNPWDVQPATISSYRTRLGYFQQFCEEQDIQDLSEIQPSHTDEYHNFLRKKPQLASRKSIKGYLASLRKFFRYCERREVFEQGFHEFVILPTISKTEKINDTWLPREEAKEIVAYLAKYEPFSKEHIVWALLAETGVRQSTLYAFDLDDYDSEERYIDVVNREDTGTRLKNGDCLVERKTASG